MGSLLGRTLNAWMDHRGGSKGAALAFYALFSMTPILVLAIALAARFFGVDAAQGEVVAQLEALVGRESTQVIRTWLGSRRDPAAGLGATLVAAVVLLAAAAAVFVELKGSLDELWGMEPPRGRAIVAFLRTQLHSFGLVLVLAFLVLLSLGANALLAVLEPYPVLSLVSSALSLGVIACLFAVIFRVLPHTRLSWRDAWVGAAFTVLLFTVGKYAIGAYLSRSTIASGFGAAGSLVALLLWVYYSAQIFFLGAEFTRQYALEFGSLAACVARVSPGCRAVSRRRFRAAGGRSRS